MTNVRLRCANSAAINPQGRFVLYWMTAQRRLQWSFALDRAIEWASKLEKPLVVLESVAGGHRWANARRHRFVLDGMADNARAAAGKPLRYYPFAESKPGEAEDLAAALGEKACVVVGDDYPIRRFAEQNERVAGRLAVPLELVDGNGLLPMQAADRVFPVAHAFRRFLQRVLPDHLLAAPKANPLSGLKLPEPPSLPRDVTRRWPSVPKKWLEGRSADFDGCPLDPSVPAAELPGGSAAAREVLKRFLDKRLAAYPKGRNHPDDGASSGLSPYLHHGHLCVHEVFHELARREAWSPDRLADKATGKREGWWGMGEAAESFLDELVTWREVGFNQCALRSDYDEYDALPDWALATLAKHAGDSRPYVYSLEEFEMAATGDPLWNAAQRQLLGEGQMHNYLRMLWGKKILHWTARPQDALDVMIELNNKYALDGEDPNSYSGIFWVLGRYDRAWGPERPIFGAVRYMTSESTQRKLRVKGYLRRYGAQAEG